MSNLYRHKVMNNFLHPLNRGKLDGPDKSFSGANPFCGDQIELTVKLDKNKKIKRIAWEGAGCAVSQAAASVFSEMIKGLTIEEAGQISNQKILNSLEVELSPSRQKCALLPLFTLKGEELTS